MFNFFNKEKDNKNDHNILSKISSLLIHAAKIDQSYTNKEKQIIKKALLELGAPSDDIELLIEESERNESDSNQIHVFTKEIKNLDEEKKKKIFECLWNIIYSDNQSDMYETNLMRRLSGLLYLDDKTVGSIKEKVKLNLKK